MVFSIASYKETGGINPVFSTAEEYTELAQNFLTRIELMANFFRVMNDAKSNNFPIKRPKK
jgi:hypothetical protein